MSKVNSQKLISLTFVIAVLAIGVAVFTYLQIAFGQSSGFTGPPGSPPTGTGLLTASGNNLGVNTATPSTTLTVNGIISSAGNLISDVATPEAGTDAANKDYVDAQSAGGGAAITMWGVSSEGIQPAAPWTQPAGTLASCIRGNRELGCGVGSISTSANTEDAPTCPTGYASAFSGYGPHAIFYGQYYYPTLGAPEPETRWTSGPDTVGVTADQIPEWHFAYNTVATSYSICSTAKNQVVQYSWSAAGVDDGSGSQVANGVVGASVAVASACAPGPGGAGASEVCNVCRVCVPE